MENLQESISAFCQKHGLRMNTDLGQHFLVDSAVLESILEAANVQTGEKILEIGPGIGILTKELLKRTDDVTAIELDKRLIPLLEKYVEREVTSYEKDTALSKFEAVNSQFSILNSKTNLNRNAEFTVINANALSVPFPTEPYKIVANIPYHITSPLLRHAFMEGSRTPTSLTLLIQREVAEKICDTEDKSMLTIIVELFGTPRIVTLVPPASFLPPPKVDSAVLQIDCFTEPKASPEIIEKIFVLTKHAFSQKRKMLRNTIPNLPGGEEGLKKANIDPQRRPQTLSIEEWMRLAEIMGGINN